jgi:hypothetical protein
MYECWPRVFVSSIGNHTPCHVVFNDWKITGNITIAESLPEYMLCPMRMVHSHHDGYLFHKIDKYGHFSWKLMFACFIFYLIKIRCWQPKHLRTNDFIKKHVTHI